ncbi:hypothetical protein U91I_00208 [alpha proteobacterium U9-1i]|nr:hypothetical protein U91I_00208 [alpha proteobacterium U9-1i]
MIASALLTVQPEADAVTIGELCRRLAVEMEATRAMGLHIEGSLCAVAVRPEFASERLHDLQMLDVMLQHLAAMRDVLSAVHSQAAPEACVSLQAVLERVTLGDLRARLHGDENVGANGRDDVEFL